MSELNINRKEFPVGSIVFYVDKSKYKWNVKWGVVEEHYSREIVIQLYDICNCMVVNGIPIKEFKTPTRWQKLPKGWSYDTELFKIEKDKNAEKLNEIYKSLKLNNKDDIKKAIDLGIFVKVQDKDYGVLEPEINHHYGWRIIKRYYKNYPTYTSLGYKMIYSTYEEAKQIIEKHESELKRQSELTDLEWSIEQIDKNIDLWGGLFSKTEIEKSKMKSRIMELSNIEDVETRIYGENIQWKYWKNSRWSNIEL